jgi:hypothetical protein
MMNKMPTETLKKILDLRAENGLEATEEAMQADLEKSKAKWVLEETPRYRKAGRSPLFISGKYLSSYGTDPATGEKDGKEPKAKKAGSGSVASPKASGKIDESVFLKVLHGKGFKVKVSQDLLTGEIQKEVPPAITKLDLQFSAIGGNASGIHITQTSPQIQVAMPLDRFLELAGIKP